MMAIGKMNNGRLTISRPNYGGEQQKISIKVRDDNSRITFLEIEIDLAKFTECLTGLSEVDCNIKTRGLGKVGKTKEMKPFEFEMPEDKKWDNDRKVIAANLASKLAPEGWKPELYFNSQNSFFDKDGKQYARTSLLRWID